MTQGIATSNQEWIEKCSRRCLGPSSVTLQVDLDTISVLINYQLASTAIFFLFLSQLPVTWQECAAKVILVYWDLKTSSDNNMIFYTALPEGTELEISFYASKMNIFLQMPIIPN